VQQSDGHGVFGQTTAMHRALMVIFAEGASTLGLNQGLQFLPY
jgi:hypothetical protein